MVALASAGAPRLSHRSHDKGTRAMKHHHIRPAGLPPVHGYSHAVAGDGRIVFISGQTPLNADGKLVEGGAPADQMAQVFANLKTALEAAGAKPTDVAKLTVYLTDMFDIAMFREYRDRIFDPEQPPASTVVQVTGFINPAFRVEIEAIALLQA
jgi:enamine deaminase RidA (YjgF/YER057c/UK114 family)